MAKWISQSTIFAFLGFWTIFWIIRFSFQLQFWQALIFIPLSPLLLVALRLCQLITRFFTTRHHFTHLPTLPGKFPLWTLIFDDREVVQLCIPIPEIFWSVRPSKNQLTQRQDMHTLSPFGDPTWKDQRPSVFKMLTLSKKYSLVSGCIVLF